MFTHKIRLLILFNLLCFSGISQQLSFIKYTVYDGLVANPIRCIYQDSKGFIWVGTFEGLSRYDGYKFTNYTKANGLSHDVINSIIEVNGKLFIAENNGAVDIIQNNSFQRRVMAGSPVNFIAPYKDRLLLTTDSNSLYEYKNDTIISPRQQKTGTSLGHLLPLDDSLLLIDGTDHYIYIFKKDLSVHYVLKNPGVYFYNLIRDSKQRIWACTTLGLRLLQITTGKKLTISYDRLPTAFNFSPVNDGPVTSMLEEKDGSFWIGTNKGLVHLLSNGDFHVYNEKEGLPSAFINTIYRDKENNLWIGTALGLAKWVSRNNVVFYNTEYKQFKNDIISINSLTNKKIILRSLHGLQQFTIDTKEFTDIRVNKSSYSISVQNNYPVLIHNRDKIEMFDSTSDVIIPLKKLDTTLEGIIFLEQHPNGTIFMGKFDGLLAIKGASVKNILPYRITAFTIDGNGIIWAGTWENGLYRVSSNSHVENHYDVTDFTSLIKEKSIRGLHADRDKNIWVGTRYGGAFRLSSKANSQFDIQRFNRQSGLMSDWVSCFAETNEGDIWIGSNQGMDRLVRSYSGYRIFNFSKAANFFAEVRKIVPAENDQWICHANNGIAYFKDENLHHTPPLQPSILTASLGVLENKLTILSPVEKIFLKPYQNSARFEFSALGFVNERQVLYSYRLKGSNDTTWSKPENIHEASYASLSPGEYAFEVKTLGWNGQYSEPASFSFFIATPFWKQWWFIGLAILAIAIFFYSLYRYRIRQLLRLQNVRNNIATDLHDDIGSSLTNISILSELSSKNLSQPEKAQPFLQRISEEVHTSSQAMDDIIWSVNSRNDSLQETMARMRRYAAELFDNSQTNCHLQLDENSGNKKLSMEQRRDVYLIYKEALTNIHKHAGAKNIWIDVSQNQNHLFMQIKDDGKGFNKDLITHRNGLKNLNTRVERWNGKIKIESIESQGTNINIKIPLKD